LNNKNIFAKNFSHNLQNSIFLGEKEPKMAQINSLCAVICFFNICILINIFENSYLCASKHQRLRGKFT